MDRHEKGLERVPGRMDAPLPEWDGGYGGDSRQLPKVVQKLLLNRPLSAEEKAELLWRFFELDQRARVRAARTRTAFLTIGFALVAFYLALYQRAWIVQHVMAWISPPAAPHAQRIRRQLPETQAPDLRYNGAFPRQPHAPRRPIHAVRTPQGPSPSERIEVVADTRSAPKRF